MTTRDWIAAIIALVVGSTFNFMSPNGEGVTAGLIGGGVSLVVFFVLLAVLPRKT